MNGPASRYLLSTLLLIAALGGYFAFSHFMAGPTPTAALAQSESSAPAATPPGTLEQPSPDTDEADGHTVWIWVAVILVAAVIVTVLFARLQRRRSEAYKKAAEQNTLNRNK